MNLALRSLAAVAEQYSSNSTIFLESIMGKEINAVEINNEVVENKVEQPLTQLNELSLALVGGGSGTVQF